MSILYSKFSSQWYIYHQAIGKAIRQEINTSCRKSFDSSETKLCTDAPSTFLIPISFIRCCVVKEAKPKRPRQEINIARIENIEAKLPISFSDLKNRLKSSFINFMSTG